MPKKCFGRLSNCFLPFLFWRPTTISKSSKKVYEVIFFWYVKARIFWKCIQYTIHWDKIRTLKKFPSDKISGTKHALFLLSRTPSNQNSAFNLRFLYELEHKVRLSQTVGGIFHFRFRFVFIEVYIFVQQNAWTLWLYNSFQN